MTTHELKTHPHFFTSINRGLKKFEIRKNDRDFQVGDELVLKEFVPDGYYELDSENIGYTGRILHRRIDYIIYGETNSLLGLAEGYCVMSLSKIGEREKNLPPTIACEHEFGALNTSEWRFCIKCNARLKQ